MPFRFVFRLKKHLWLIVIALLCCTKLAHAQTQSLNYYLSQSVLHSPLLLSFDNGIKQNGVDSLLIESKLKPQANFDAAFSYAPLLGGIGYDTVITNLGNYSAVVQVTQNLFQKNIAATQFDDLHISNQSLSNQKQITAAELANTITSLYLGAWQAQQNWQSAVAQSQLLALQKQALKPLVDVAIYQQADYLKLVIENQQQDINAAQLKQTYRAALFQLSYNCGITDTSFVLLQQPELKKNTAIVNSLYQKQFVLDSLHLVNSTLQINQQYLPQFSWFADAGMMSSTVYNAYQHVGFSAGVALHVPLYDGHQKTLELQKIKIDQLQQNQFKDQLQLQMNIKQTWISKTENENLQLLNQYNAQKQNVNQLIDFYKQQLPQGTVRISDLLDAYAQLLDINNQIINLQIQNLQLINDYNLLNH